MGLTDSQKALKNLYNNRNKFIILGLTGRTGSGCSKLADLLASKTFEGLNATPPDILSKQTNKSRKNKICYNFLKHNWAGFTKIHLSDVILTFLIQEDVSDVIKYSKSVIGELELEGLKELGEKAKGIRSEFDDLRKDGEVFLQESFLADFFEGDEASQEKQDFYKKARELYSKITELRLVIKKSFGEHYYKLFQTFGDNIRNSGSPLSDKVNPDAIFIIPERVNVIIKFLRRYNKYHGKKDYFVLDSIRNEMEAVFFRERFSAFYLLSVNTDDEVRKSRLVSNDLGDEKITALDQREYPNALSSYDAFSKINIQRCIEIADIHLTNNSGVEEISNQIVTYLSLILKPGLVPPTAHERMMQVAYTAKFNSGCISRQVGAVISDTNHSVKSVGWNNSPCGQVSCALRSTEDLKKERDSEAFSEYEKNDEGFKNKLQELFPNKIEGLPKSYCFKKVINKINDDKNQVHTRSLHAEENAMMQLTKYGGMGVTGGYLYTTASPCELCSKKAYQLHIKKVIYIDPYPGIAISHILKSGSCQPELELFSGVVGMAYFKLYEPFLPYKDELEIHNSEGQ